MDDPVEGVESAPDSDRDEQGRRGFIELLAGLTGVAQERLARTLDDVMTRGEAARDDVRRNAFKTLFPDQAARLEAVGRRVDILEARLAEQSIVAGPRPDAQRHTGFASTAEVPDDKVTGPSES